MKTLILFSLFIYFFFYLWWILSYIEMKQPRVYMCSPSQSPHPPPTPPIPSRFSQCTRSEHLSHASNLGWWSVSLFSLFIIEDTRHVTVTWPGLAVTGLFKWLVSGDCRLAHSCYRQVLIWKLRGSSERLWLLPLSAPCSWRLKQACEEQLE